MQRRLPVARWFTLLLLFAAAWWILTEGTVHSWGVGIPAVLLTTYVAARLQNPNAPHVRLVRVPGFACFFLTRSVIAGIDVARRTFKPQLDLNPGFLRYRSQLPEGTPRLLFAIINSLLPGSLCAEFKGDDIVVHVLDIEDDNVTLSQELEQHIVHLLGLEALDE